MSKKILVADDNREITDLLVAKLESRGYTAFAAYDGTYTIAQVRKEKPDLIILDISMPAGTGMKVCENLKSMQDTSRIPIIFLTAYDDDDLRDKALMTGAYDFVTKPFDSDILLETVGKALGE